MVDLCTDRRGLVAFCDLHDTHRLRGRSTLTMAVNVAILVAAIDKFSVVVLKPEGIDFAVSAPEAADIRHARRGNEYAPAPELFVPFCSTRTCTRRWAGCTTAMDVPWLAPAEGQGRRGFAVFKALPDRRLLGPFGSQQPTYSWACGCALVFDDHIPLRDGRLDVRLPHPTSAVRSYSSAARAEMTWPRSMARCLVLVDGIGLRAIGQG